MKERIFLLGGHDLEMLEIKRILLSHNELVYDLNLTWNNAFLLHYKDILVKHENNLNLTIYGIELIFFQEDRIPTNFKLIDHHNQFSNNPSSIEQIAELIGIKLSREQELISANDKGYIKAMLKMNATENEIKSIRLKDRQAQGVTDLDEILAKKSIEKMEKHKDVLVVKAETPMFSAIIDNLYPFNKLIIYSEDDLTYYGKGKNYLVDVFKKEISQKNIYHGGSNDGFLGISKGVYSKNEINQLINIIINTIGL